MGTDGLRDSSTLRLKATLAARGRGGRNARRRGMRCLNAPHVCTWLRQLRGAKGAINIRYGMPCQCVTPIGSSIDTRPRSAAKKAAGRGRLCRRVASKDAICSVALVWIVGRLAGHCPHSQGKAWCAETVGCASPEARCKNIGIGVL